MATLHVEPFSYRADSSQTFACLADLPNPVFLDSATSNNPSARFDIISAAPVHIFRETLENSATHYSDANPLFEEITRYVADTCIATYPDNPDTPELPFIGGAIGFLSYDLCRRQIPLLKKAANQAIPPLACVGIYQWALIIDHRYQRSYLVAQPGMDKALLATIRARLLSTQSATLPEFELLAPFRSNLSQQDYAKAFDKIQTYIHAGDCYQVNLAQRFSSTYRGHPWTLYAKLRRLATAPFSNYMDFGDDCRLLSFSPERFIQVKGRKVLTQPIKGTRPRHNDRIKDQQLADELANSGKDRAENLMIVDLLRNDLGKNCIPGSIKVSELMALQSFNNVHHLVSSIEGELSKDKTAMDVLAGSFPGGSITGAPKRRAIEIIDELEPDYRSVYCGSSFYYSANGNLDSNINIRTLLCSHKEVHCWGGGGIVADSDCDGEYQESMTKINQLINL